jgi:hypothetical protein
MEMGMRARALMTAVVQAPLRVTVLIPLLMWWLRALLAWA